MTRPDRGRVLAIGVDAAEPTLVRRLIDRGELPRLRGLLERGVWAPVRSPARIASAAIWPSFMTGRPVFDHGIFGEWAWRPDTMALDHVSTDHLVPFWKALALQGFRVGVLDVPYAPVVGVPKGIEISGWGAHDRLLGRMDVSPPSRLEWIRAQAGSHPLASGAVDASGPHDQAGLGTVATLCLAGARQRGTLASRLLAETAADVLLVVFPEVHHAAHVLWHTIDPDHPAHRPAADWPIVGSALLDLYGEVDRQIGQLVDLAGDDATVLVFSLHGMRSAQGLPTILDPVLRATGFAEVPDWAAQTWSARARRAVAALRRRIPQRVKHLYYRLLSRSMLVRLAQPGMLPAYDWSRTVAFPLPTDQHGWIRLNLAGREAQGALDARAYDATCARIERLLRGLRGVDGRAVVREVLLVAQEGDETPPEKLPDLVVHWDDAASASPLRLATPAVSAYPDTVRFTGQHTPDGFLILRPGARGVEIPRTPVAAEDLHRLVAAGLGRG